MVAKFHYLSFRTDEPVGVLFLVGLIKASLLIEVFILALLLTEIVTFFLKCLCLTEFRIPDIVEKVEGADKVFFR